MVLDCDNSQLISILNYISYVNYILCNYNMYHSLLFNILTAILIIVISGSLQDTTI